VLFNMVQEFGTAVYRCASKSATATAAVQCIVRVSRVCGTVRGHVATVRVVSLKKADNILHTGTFPQWHSIHTWRHVRLTWTTGKFWALSRTSNYNFEDKTRLVSNVSAHCDQLITFQASCLYSGSTRHLFWKLRRKT